MHSGIINRKTQSYASSPQYLSDYLKSSQSSPLLKESPEVEKLLKCSLKRFKSEKAELERIKEIALSFKSARQKKLKSYNLQTRLGNKIRSKIKRPKTVWVSPENKEFWNEGKKPKPRHQLSSVERRANIGLEHFNLKSPRNHTPKDVQDGKAKNIGEGNRKKSIEDFIKKKKRERIEKEKQKRTVQQENELKRMKMLVKVEKKAKCALRKKKKVRGKKGGCVKIVPESFEFNEKRIRNSEFRNEDEEVFKIIHKSVLKGGDSGQDSNRSCKDVKGSLVQDKIPNSKLSKLNIKLKKTRKPSRPSQNMPIIELLSISHSSSSDLSEQKKHLQKQIDDIRHRMDSIKDAEKYSKTTLLKAQNALKTIVLKSLSEKFFLIKYSNFYNSNALPAKSRESSEDMEKIWDKIETYRPLEFLQDNDSVSSLVPFDESLKNSRQNSKRPSEDLNPNDLFKTNTHQESIKIREESEESSFETQLYLDNKITFEKNLSMLEVRNEPEPTKPEFLPQKPNKSEILIDDASESVQDSIPFIKDTEERSYIETPEAEEVEEFNHADYNSMSQDKALSNESGSNTLLFEDTLEIVIDEILNEFIFEAAEFDYNKTYFQLVGNNKCIIYDVCVRTGVTAVMKFIEKLWAEVDLHTIRNRMVDKSLHLHILSTYRQDPWTEFDGVIKKKTLRRVLKKLVENQTAHLAVEIHNKAIFDTVNEILFRISTEVNPVPWKDGKLCVTGLDLDRVFKEVNLNVRKFCMVNAGRVANVSMVNANGTVDLELLQRIRENGLTCLLTAEIEQIEKDWVDYEAEEHQTVNELSSYVLDELAFEVADIMFFKNI